MGFRTGAARCWRASMASAGVALAACGGGGSPSIDGPTSSGDSASAAPAAAMAPAGVAGPRSTIESRDKRLGISTQIKVLSNRADLISGGNALVEVVLS